MENKLTKLSELYKEWVNSNNLISWYGDFESADELTFEVRKPNTSNEYIFVGHPEGAEDYGEGESGGVNGFISTVRNYFEGEFKIEIPYCAEEWDNEFYKCTKRQLNNLAKKYGLVLDIFPDLGLARPRVYGKEFMSQCSTEELKKYVSFFSALNDEVVFDENMSYFTWSICGHDDYYKFIEVDGEWYIFWITRYDPNF